MLRCQEVIDHFASLPIDDDDLCAECKRLHYCPGQLSLCDEALKGRAWPCTFDDNGCAASCGQMEPIERAEENWVPDARQG